MSDSLRFATGYHQWISSDDKLRVDKLHDDSGHQRHEQVIRLVRNDDEDSLQQKTLSTSDLAIITKTRSESEEEIDNDEYSLSHMDVSFSQVDFQLYLNHNQTPLMRSRYQGFSSPLGNFYPTEKLKLVKDHSAPHPPDMDMENGGDHRSKHNGHSQQQQQYNNGFSGSNQQSNGSSNGHGNGYNPNRNDKNSRR